MVIVVVVKMVQTHSLGEKTMVFCRARSCVEEIPEKRHVWIGSRKGGTAGGKVSPSWRQFHRCHGSIIFALGGTCWHYSEV